MKTIATLILAVAMATPAFAQTCQAPQPYFVSMLLGKNDAPTVVRLVHAQQLACSSEEAAARLMQMVAKEFSGYKILDTITTPVNPVGREVQQAGRATYTDV